MYTVRLKNGNQHYVRAENLCDYGGRISLTLWAGGASACVANFDITHVDSVVSEEWHEPKPYQYDTCTNAEPIQTIKTKPIVIIKEPKIKSKTTKKRTTK
jgi:hypothetical protein